MCLTSTTLPARPSGYPHHTRLHQTVRAMKALTIPSPRSSPLLNCTWKWSGRSLILNAIKYSPSCFWQVRASFSVLTYHHVIFPLTGFLTGCLVYLLCGWMMRLCRSRKCTFLLFLLSMKRTDWHRSCSGSR